MPLALAAMLLPKVYGNQLLLFNFVVFLTLAQGVNVIYGFTGYLPFGYVGFFGAGAYGFSLCVIHAHLPPVAALAAGMLAAAVLALLLSPLLRLSGAYFAIANLAASLALYQVVSNPNLTDITNGPYGISLSGVYQPVLSYGIAVAIMTATLGVGVYLSELSLRARAASDPGGPGQRRDGRRRRRAFSHAGVAGRRDRRRPHRR